MTSLTHLITVLLLHYLVKCKSCSLAVYTNEFILLSACIDLKITEKHKIIENLLHI